MLKFLRPVVLFSAAWAFFGLAPVSEACWCNRVFTRYYCDPCVACPTVARSYFVPAPCAVPVCPTTSCSTTNVERCYYEPQTTYETRSLMQPQVSYIRRDYYDPLCCSYRTFLEPVTQYVERSYQVPVTSWVRRCATEPVTTCSTTYTAVAPSRVSYYWSPDGIHYYPTVTTVVAPSCPVPSTNGTTQRGAEYGPAGETKKNGDSAKEPAKIPPPVPMPAPEKKEGTKAPGARRSQPFSNRSPVLAGAPVRVRTGPAPPSSQYPVRATRF